MRLPSLSAVPVCTLAPPASKRVSSAPGSAWVICSCSTLSRTLKVAVPGSAPGEQAAPQPSAAQRIHAERNEDGGVRRMAPRITHPAGAPLKKRACGSGENGFDERQEDV